MTFVHTTAWVTQNQFDALQHLGKMADELTYDEHMEAFRDILSLLAMEGRLKNPSMIQLIGGPVRFEIRLIIGNPPPPEYR
jgi:hypothetical protein